MMVIKPHVVHIHYTKITLTQLANVLPSVVLDRTGPIRSAVTICYWIGRSNFTWTVRSLFI